MSDNEVRLIDANAFCAFLREVSTRHHYETLLTKKDKYPTVTDVIEEICCELDGSGLKGFDNAPTVEQPTGEWIPVSERLPEESLNSVIGWDSYRERCVFVQYIDGHFQIMGKAESFDIIAWMPLPKPYKKGGNV